MLWLCGWVAIVGAVGLVEPAVEAVEPVESVAPVGAVGDDEHPHINRSTMSQRRLCGCRKVTEEIQLVCQWACPKLLEESLGAWATNVARVTDISVGQGIMKTAIHANLCIRTLIGSRSASAPCFILMN